VADQTNWVGVTPDPPSLQGTPGVERHFIPTQTASWTVCGISVPHHAAGQFTTDAASVTCYECREYLQREAELDRRAHDCSIDGHEYEMIEVRSQGDATQPGLIGIECGRCQSSWRVERNTSESS
jgi:hypothetical protein